jgi:hypothetical protein
MGRTIEESSQRQFIKKPTTWRCIAVGPDSATLPMPPHISALVANPHESAFLAVRSAHNMQHQANFAVGWMVHCTRIVLAHFRPNENLGEWYRRDVKPLADSLRALRVVITEHDAE